MTRHAILLLSLTLNALVYAAASATALVVPRLGTPPTIDGRRSAGEWDGAATFTGFQTQIPDTPLDWRQSRVWIGYDATHLYVAVASPNYPAGVPLVAARTRRDGGFFGDDVIELLLDPHDGRHDGSQPYFYLIVNSRGVIGHDSREMPGIGQTEMTWNGSAIIANGVDDDTWVFEMALPLADLGIPAGAVPGHWRIGVSRTYTRPVSWTNWPSTGQINNPAGGAAATFAPDLPFVRLESVEGLVRDRAAGVTGEVVNPGPAAAAVDVSLTVAGTPEPVVVTLAVPAGGRAPFRLDLPELPATGNARLLAKAGQTVLYDDVLAFHQPTAQPLYEPGDGATAFDGELRHLPSLDQVVARADLFAYPNRQEVRGARLSLRDATDAVVRQQALPLAPDATLTGALELAGLAEGQYTMELALQAADGKTVAAIRRDMWRRRFPWVGAAIGTTDTVPPPWTPLTVRDSTVGCWARDYVFDGMALPAAITVKEENILARPIAVVATLAGQETVLRAARPATVGAAAPSRVELTGGNDRVAVATAIDYDGLLRIRLTVAPGSVDGLRLELPLAAAQATLIHAVGDHMRNGQFSGLLPDGEGQVWSSATHLTNRSIFGTFLPYFWLGAEDRGLCWTATSDEGWELDDDAAAMTVSRRADEVVASIHFIGRPTVLAAPRTFEFGLQATPVKPMPPGWRAWSFDPDSWPRTPGSRRIQYYPGRSYFWDSTDAFGLEPADWDALQQRYAAFCERQDADAAVLTTTLNILGAGTEAAKVFRDEWFIGELQLATSSWKREQFGPDKDHYRFGAVALLPTVRDYRLWTAGELIRRAGVTGIYEDNSYLWPVVNRDLGIGYRREDGEWQGEFLVWANRDYHQRLANLFHEAGVEPLIWTHMTTANILPAFSHATVAYDGEWKEIGDDTPDFMKQWPLDYFRAVDLWQHSGLVPLWLPMAHLVKDPAAQVHHTRCMLAVLQLHDILCDNGHAAVAPIRDLEVARLAFGIGDPDVVFHGYWENGERLELDADLVKCSFWEKPDRALFVLANFATEPTTVNGTFDRPLATAREAMSGAAVTTAGKRFTVTVPPRDFQLVQVEFARP